MTARSAEGARFLPKEMHLPNCARCDELRAERDAALRDVRLERLRAAYWRTHARRHHSDSGCWCPMDGPHGHPVDGHTLDDCPAFIALQQLRAMGEQP